VSGDLAGGLAVLREKFVRNALEKLELLDQNLSRLAAEPGDTQTLDRAMRLFHSLAGSGATYGFPEVSRSAGAAESLCDEIAAARRGVTEAEIASMRSGVEAIRRAFGEDEQSEADLAAQRILIAEDDAGEASFLTLVLETAGYVVRTCDDLTYAAVDCADFKPHLLLLDEEAATRLAPMMPDHLGRGGKVLAIRSLGRAKGGAPSGTADGVKPSPRIVLETVARVLAVR
jgi:HPt (histidine-containing phosphotransfer) domain-containing protein